MTSQQFSNFIQLLENSTRTPKNSIIENQGKTVSTIASGKGVLSSYIIYNIGTSTAWVKFWDLSDTPDPSKHKSFYKIPVLAGQAICITGDPICKFDNNLFVTATLNMADTDNTDPQSNLFILVGIKQ